MFNLIRNFFLFITFYIILDLFLIWLSVRSHYILDYYNNLNSTLIAIFASILISFLGLCLLKKDVKLSVFSICLTSYSSHFLFKSFVLPSVFTVAFSEKLEVDMKTFLNIKLIILFGFFISFYFIYKIIIYNKKNLDFLVFYIPAALFIFYFEMLFFN